MLPEEIRGPTEARALHSAQLTEREPPWHPLSLSLNKKWRQRNKKKDVGCCLGQMVHREQMPGTDAIVSSRSKTPARPVRLSG